jgi:hypothetical protein
MGEKVKWRNGEMGRRDKETKVWGKSPSWASSEEKNEKEKN